MYCVSHKFIKNYKMRYLSSLQIVYNPITFEMMEEIKMEKNDTTVYVKK